MPSLVSAAYGIAIASFLLHTAAHWISHINNCFLSVVGTVFSRVLRAVLNHYAAASPPPIFFCSIYGYRHSNCMPPCLGSPQVYSSRVRSLLSTLDKLLLGYTYSWVSPPRLFCSACWRPCSSGCLPPLHVAFLPRFFLQILPKFHSKFRCFSSIRSSNSDVADVVSQLLCCTHFHASNAATNFT